jgi:chemotaxis protein MotB
VATSDFFNPKRVTVDESDQEGWMVAYADLITLLFVFFTMLLSISVISRTKFEMMSRELNATTPTDLVSVKQELDKSIAAQKLEGSVSTVLNEEGLAVEFSESVLFPSADAKLHAQGADVLRKFAGMLKTIPKAYRLAVEGHTDSRPIHTSTFPSNWALSAARSVSVVHLLKDSGIDEKRIVLHSFADTRPLLAKEHANLNAEQLYSKNRRVTLLIY